MKVTYCGHACFSVVVGGKTLHLLHPGEAREF
jgi:L-ascorbate metabolism protein UlaG (beta-lactamase superfamily)